MLLERYYDESLAQASYLIGCDHTGEAIVIDPNRDVGQYVTAAKMRRMRIRFATETHIHADFLSGSRELAKKTGATLLLSGHGDDDWRYTYAESEGARLVHDGDSITVGQVRVDVLHTPGHTPEHVCFLITDTATGDRPMGLVSGDFLFVGDVGRPDLLERAAKVSGSMQAAARQLFASLKGLRGLPNYLQIWPGHGAGSACGKALGSVPQSTLGYERLYNPALQHKTEDAFVRWVLEDQPEPPPYFATMKRLNRDGPPIYSVDGRGWMSANDVQVMMDAGASVVDLRMPSDFAQEHFPRSINIPLAKTFTTYAGTVLSYDRPVVLIGGPELSKRAIAQLAMIGFDHVGVAKSEVIQENKTAGKGAGSVQVIDSRALAARLKHNGVQVIDVRGRSEWNHGHLPTATHMYLGDLVERTAAWKKSEPIVVHCQSGTRSSIAASLLMARGFTDVTNLSGGFDAWRKAGLPASKE